MGYIYIYIGGYGVGVGGGWVIIILQGVLTKTNLLMKFRHLKIFLFFGIFLLWDRVKLNFRDRYGKPHIYSKNSSCYRVFHQILKNCHFGVKKKSLSMQMDLYDPYKSPYTIS